MSTLPTIQCIPKKGPHNKWFDCQAVIRTKTLYESQFGKELPVTKRLIRDLNIKYLLYIEQNTTTVAASMVTQSMPSLYLVKGIAVDPLFQRRGYATALIHKIEATLPNHSTLQLGVDKGKENTEWLVEWYSKLGYEYWDSTEYEIYLEKYIERDE